MTDGLCGNAEAIVCMDNGCRIPFFLEEARRMLRGSLREKAVPKGAACPYTDFVLFML